MTQGSGYNLPDKLYFRIGEVSDIVGVKPYVLRYWETEFSDIKPTKSKSGQRLYRKKDVELLLKIKDLLYTERFTINGAKQRLKEVGKPGDPTAVIPTPEQQVAPTPIKSETLTTVAQVESQAAPKEAMLPFEDVEDDQVVEQVPEKTKVQTAQTTQTTSSSGGTGNVDRKFLEKMKTDLEWCLNEMRAS